MVKRVLMIAYHYPPQHGSSGIQRSLKFSKYLPESGWHPIVLSAHPRAFTHTSNDQMAEIPETVKVERTFALDAAKHMAIGGRYLRMAALPDRWISWWLGAVPAGLRLICKYKPDVIWSTYPIATAHLIGYSLHRLTGIPWVADFRDVMTDADYPTVPIVRRVYQWIERKAVENCALAVFTSPGAVITYQKRYPHIPASRFCLIENGYDEENFDAGSIPAPQPHAEKPFILLHSGIIYPLERDPVPFFEALAALLQQGSICGKKIQVVLRAAHHETYLEQLIEQYGIGGVVKLMPPVSYRAALGEMLHADGLLVLQGSNCNDQIPAKLYEYFRAQRPILGLADLSGDTAATLRNAGIHTLAPLDSKEKIMQAFMQFLAMAQSGDAPIASMDKVISNSRKSRTKELASLFDRFLPRR